MLKPQMRVKNKYMWGGKRISKDLSWEEMTDI